MPKELAPHGKRRPSPYEKTKERERSEKGEPFLCKRDEMLQSRLTERNVPLVQKVYCSFCGGRTGEQRHECIECGAVVCEQDSPDEIGCVALGTISKLVPFLCLLCDQKEWKKAPRSRANPTVSWFVFELGRWCLMSEVRFHRLRRKEACQVKLAFGANQHAACWQLRQFFTRRYHDGCQTPGQRKREWSIF